MKTFLSDGFMETFSSSSSAVVAFLMYGYYQFYSAKMANASHKVGKREGVTLFSSSWKVFLFNRLVVLNLNLSVLLKLRLKISLWLKNAPFLSPRDCVCRC